MKPRSSTSPLLKRSGETYHHAQNPTLHSQAANSLEPWFAVLRHQLCTCKTHTGFRISLCLSESFSIDESHATPRACRAMIASSSKKSPKKIGNSMLAQCRYRMKIRKAENYSRIFSCADRHCFATCGGFAELIYYGAVAQLTLLQQFCSHDMYNCNLE